MTPPKLIKPYVISFCRSFVTDPQPDYIPVEPLPGEKGNECFVIVERQISKYGGSQQIGWTIWEWPKVFIEAEFHAVWRQDDHLLIDLTPKPIPMLRILFVSDHKRKYKGRQIDNIRKPLVRDRDLSRFCDVSHLIHMEQNKGDLADYHGIMPVTPILEKYFHEKAALFERLCRRYGHPATTT